MAEDNKEETCIEQVSSPHEAMLFVMAYLPLFELLTMTRVCKSLRDAVKTDILPWLKIIVDRPLDRRISDDVLVQVASKAKGRLQVLVLINCGRITDDGLLRVVALNPGINKLHVPGCTSLSPEGIIKAVMLLTKDPHHTLATLRIEGIYGVQKHHLHTLHNLINPNPTQHKILYHNYNRFSTLNVTKTNRTIDLDICPKCNEVRMVFDCPRLHSQKQQQCRGCASCIVRCTECSICLKDSEEQEEATCGDTLCLECWLTLPKCNFCNKPNCRRHDDQVHSLSGSIGFICDNCQSKFN